MHCANFTCTRGTPDPSTSAGSLMMMKSRQLSVDGVGKSLENQLLCHSVCEEARTSCSLVSIGRCTKLRRFYMTVSMDTDYDCTLYKY